MPRNFIREAISGISGSSGQDNPLQQIRELYHYNLPISEQGYWFYQTLEQVGNQQAWAIGQQNVQMNAYGNRLYFNDYHNNYYFEPIKYKKVSKLPGWF